jgi:hypothetical protein
MTEYPPFHFQEIPQIITQNTSQTSPITQSNIKPPHIIAESLQKDNRPPAKKFQINLKSIFPQQPQSTMQISHPSQNFLLRKSDVNRYRNFSIFFFLRLYFDSQAHQEKRITRVCIL